MDLPPLVQIAIKEKLWTCTSPSDLKQVIVSQALNEEFARQAQWSIEEFEYADASDAGRGRFAVTPTGSLNPFSTVGKCFGEPCTAETVNDFIKSVGLYSECAALPEPLTPYFLDGPDLSDYYYKNLFRDIQILGKIAPLVEANVLLLGNPAHGYCADCALKTEKLLSDATDSILSGQYHCQVKLVSSSQGFQLGIQIPELQPDHSHPVTTYVPITKSEAALLRRMSPSGIPTSKAGQKVLQRVINDRVKSDLTSVFFELEMSRNFGSLLLAGSRAETLVIATLDKAAPSLAEIDDWERLRNCTFTLGTLPVTGRDSNLATRSE